MPAQSYAVYALDTVTKDPQVQSTWPHLRASLRNARLMVFSSVVDSEMPSVFQGLSPQTTRRACVAHELRFQLAPAVNSSLLA